MSRTPEKNIAGRTTTFLALPPTCRPFSAFAKIAYRSALVVKNQAGLWRDLQTLPVHQFG
jgi:hypothetical protein